MTKSVLCARCVIDGSTALLRTIHAVRPKGHAFPAPRATFRGIVRNAAVLAEMPVQKILGKSRFRPEVRVRQAIVWVALRATKLSTVDIGRRLGGRDHSTILHARDQSEAFYERDPEFAAFCERLWAATEAEPFGMMLAEVVDPEPETPPEAKPAKVWRTVKVRHEPGEYVPHSALDWKLEAEPECDAASARNRAAHEAGSRALLAALQISHPERFAA